MADKIESAALPVVATPKTVASTEIRKLKPAELFNLSLILNMNNSWKKLMEIMPKEGCENEYEFSQFHFDLIEQASHQQKRGCGEILLDEWGTMGRKRPTVKNLLDLLVKAELFRAADYLAISVLNCKEGPKRPATGPAAKVDVSALIEESAGTSEEVTTKLPRCLQDSSIISLE